MRITDDTGEMTARRPGEWRGRRPAARVLVAEDERDVAELIRYTLAREGFEVILATNGADALRQARESRPDVVLLDLMLPQVNGWELCRRLKQDPATRALPVIMVTARAEEGDKVLGFELGADDYVTKPFSRASWSPGSAPSSGGAGRPRSRSGDIGSRWGTSWWTASGSRSP